MNIFEGGISIMDGSNSDLVKKHLDHELLDDDGIIRLLPAAHYEKYSWNDLRLWMHLTPAYNIPTIELVDCLKYIIGVRPALEVAAGNGWLAHHLGIRATDSKLHEQPEIKRHFKSMGQIPVTYGKNVEKFDAVEAVRRYHPDVVIAAWPVQLGTDDVPFSAPKGVNEMEIIKRADYVLCGTVYGHSAQLINQFEYEEFLPKMVSRQQYGNFLRAWQKNPPRWQNG